MRAAALAFRRISAYSESKHCNLHLIAEGPRMRAPDPSEFSFDFLPMTYRFRDIGCKVTHKFGILTCRHISVVATASACYIDFIFGSLVEMP